MLVIIAALLFLFAALVVHNVPVLINPAAVAPGSNNPLLMAGQDAQSTLDLTTNYSVVYEQQGNVYVTSTTNSDHQLIPTPGYIYSPATPPLLTPAGKLLYSGKGLWLTDISTGQVQQVASIPATQVITSMVLSSDGTTLAWSAAPANGNGMIDIYEGPIGATKFVYQQSAAHCPCFRVFSFANGSGQQGDTTLLLADDEGDHLLARYGLWTLDLSHAPSASPQPLLSSKGQAKPISLIPHANALLYANQSGFVPPPEDTSVPLDIPLMAYANSLAVSTISGTPPALAKPQVILPGQKQLNNSADYHWVLTPRFSPDGQILVYIVFSSDTQLPFTRHSALYTAHLSGSGTDLQVGQPHLLATASSRYIELGPWLNNHILTFYADGFLYALDTSSGAVMVITHTGAYARIAGVLQGHG
jgi:hypothetical protein